MTPILDGALFPASTGGFCPDGREHPHLHRRAPGGLRAVGANLVSLYLPIDLSAAPLFSIPEPVPSAIFLAPHLSPRPVALTPLTLILPVAAPVLTTAVLADPPAALMSCPAPSWPKAAETGTIKQIDRKMFLAARMVLLYRKIHRMIATLLSEAAAQASY